MKRLLVTCAAMIVASAPAIAAPASAPIIRTPDQRSEPPSTRRWLLALDLAGSTAIGGTVEGVSPRFVATVGWRPRRGTPVHLAARLDAGPSVAITRGNVEWRWADVGAALGVAWLPTVGPVDLGPIITAGLHRATLAGKSIIGANIDRAELVGSLGLDLLLIYRVPPGGVPLWPTARLGVTGRWGETSYGREQEGGFYFDPAPMTLELAVGVQFAY